MTVVGKKYLGGFWKQSWRVLPPATTPRKQSSRLPHAKGRRRPDWLAGLAGAGRRASEQSRPPAQEGRDDSADKTELAGGHDRPGGKGWPASRQGCQASQEGSPAAAGRADGNPDPGPKLGQCGSAEPGSGHGWAGLGRPGQKRPGMGQVVPGPGRGHSWPTGWSMEVQRGPGPGRPGTSAGRAEEAGQGRPRARPGLGQSLYRPRARGGPARPRAVPGRKVLLGPDKGRPRAVPRSGPGRISRRSRAGPAHGWAKLGPGPAPTLGPRAPGAGGRRLGFQSPMDRRWCPRSSWSHGAVDPRPLEAIGPHRHEFTRTYHCPTKQKTTVGKQWL